MNEEDERSLPSTHQIPGGHGIDIRGFEKSVDEGELVKVVAIGGSIGSGNALRDIIDEDFYVVFDPIIDMRRVGTL